MNKKIAAIFVCLSFVLAIPIGAFAQQQNADSRTGRVMLGGNLGMQAGTADDDVAAALVLSMDYFPDENLSLGPLLQVGFTGDLTQFGLSMQAKYTVDLRRARQLKPNFQAGLGFLHVDMDRPPAGPNDTELGFLVPFGMGLDYEVASNMLVGTTLLLNFTDANIQGEQVGNVFMTWVFGLKVLI